MDPSFSWLNSPLVQKLFDILGRENLRFVGGAVRDSLLGLKVSDLDAATKLEPLEVTARLEHSTVSVVPTGLKHGTVTIVENGEVIEVTSLRRDVATDGRHATVEYTDDWRVDAARRDFTINALYVDHKGDIHDYFDGIKDLAARRVCFIGDPKRRIEEDGLRILRFFRFNARYGGTVLDPAGLDACRLMKSSIASLSIERVRDETLKILSTVRPAATVSAMMETGVFQQVFPDISKGERSVAADLLARLERCEEAIGYAPTPLPRLVLLYGFDANRLDNVGKRLKLTNKDRRFLQSLCDAHSYIASAMHGRDMTPAQGLLRARYFWGDSAAQSVVPALGCDAPALFEAWEQVKDRAIPPFPLSGKDMRVLGIKPGPDIGLALETLEQIWVTSDFQLSKKELLSRF